MEEQVPIPDSKILEELLWYRMPFGKHKAMRIRELPTYYLEWFARKGFPKGKLGELMQTMFIIRTNGLDFLLDQLQEIKDREEE